MPTLGFLLSMSNIITLNRAVSRPVINQSLELFYFSSFLLLFFFFVISLSVLTVNIYRKHILFISSSRKTNFFAYMKISLDFSIQC